MGDNFIQNAVTVLGSSASPVTLTGSYSDDNSGLFKAAKGQKISLFVYYTMGAAESSNSIQVKVQTSPDRLAIDSALWGRRTREAVAAGTATLSVEEYTFTATQSAGTYDVIEIPLPNINTPYFKVSAKETGIASNGGSCYIKAVVSGR